MNVRLVKASELVAYANECVAKGGEIPITPARAASQAANPAVKPDFVLLIVVRDSFDELVGYMGILPTDASNVIDKIVYWNTCWWVKENVGAAVSMTLFSHLLKHTDKQIAFSDLTEHTVKIIERFGTFTVDSRRGAVIRCRSGLHARLKYAGGKNLLKKLLAASYMFRIIDEIRNTGYAKRLKKALGMPSAVVEVKEEVDRLTDEWIMMYCDATLGLPNRKIIAWWQQYPWLIKKSAETRKLEASYYFSSVAGSFEIKVLTLSDRGQRIGVCIISLRDGVLKTQYLYMKESFEHIVYDGVMRFIQERKDIHSIISFHEGFISWIKSQKLPFISMKVHRRYTAISQTLLDRLIEPPVMQDGDGDYIFT